MNKEEYLLTLYDALKDIPGEARTSIVSEYRDYFTSELNKGKSEEEISLSLGDPFTLAYATKQRHGYGAQNQGAQNQGASYEKSRRSFGPFKKIASVITVIVIIFTVIGGPMMFSISKGSGLIFGIGKKYELNDIQEINLDSAKTIIVRTSSADTSILQSDYEKIRGTLVGNVRATSPDYVPTLEVTKSGDSIIIEEKRKAFAIIGFNWERINIDISIPESFQGDLKYEGKSGDFNTSDLDINNFIFKLSSGTVRLDNITLKNDMDLTSTSGDLTIKGLKAKNFTLKSTSGNKKFSGVSIEDNFDINSTSGDTSLKGINCNELQIDSTSGVISIDGIQVDLISVDSKSGNINIEDLEGSVQLKAISGNIKVLVKEAKDEIYLKASSGDVELKMPANTGFTLDSKTSSGSINCDFDLDVEDSGDHKLRGSYGNGTIPIYLSTTSGNIDIDKR